MEKAEYAKSDAPKLMPSKTKANAFTGCVRATNCGKDNIVIISSTLATYKQMKMY